METSEASFTRPVPSARLRSRGEPRVLPVDVITSQVIRELSPGLLAYAHRRVGQRQEAEDLVQDTWLCALRSAPTFEGRSSLRTWLSTILRRRIAERFRRSRPWLLLEEEDTLTPQHAQYDRLDLALAGSIANVALASLSEPERNAIALCDVQDLDRDEASQQLGVTRGHLRVLLHRGRSKLATSLRASGFES